MSQNSDTFVKGLLIIKTKAMEFVKSELKKLSLADLKVLSDESDKQYANFTNGSPEYNYHIGLIEAVAAEKVERIKVLVKKDDDEMTDAEKDEKAK